LAQNGHRRRIVGCPLLGEKRTSHLHEAESAFDPTWASPVFDIDGRRTGRQIVSRSEQRSAAINYGGNYGGAFRGNRAKLNARLRFLHDS
jgi:hypothetical protein